MKDLTTNELTIIFNLTKDSVEQAVRALHLKVEVELSFRGAFL